MMAQLGNSLLQEEKTGIKIVKKCFVSTWDSATRMVQLALEFSKDEMISQLENLYVIKHSQKKYPVVFT